MYKFISIVTNYCVSAIKNLTSDSEGAGLFSSYKIYIYIYIYDKIYYENQIHRISCH